MKLVSWSLGYAFSMQLVSIYVPHRFLMVERTLAIRSERCRLRVLGSPSQHWKCRVGIGSPRVHFRARGTGAVRHLVFYVN